MSIKLMKQRWLMEDVDNKKDSNEIVDMDVDEKDEYEIISEMEKPTNFLTQGSAENAKPSTDGMDVQSQRLAASAEVKKRPSRWDVGAPFCVKLNDVLKSNATRTTVEACIGDFAESQSRPDNEEISGNGKGKICSSDEIVEKVTNMKIEEEIASAGESVAVENEYRQKSSSFGTSLDEISLPCDIVLPSERSEPVSESISDTQLSSVSGQSECDLKGKVSSISAALETSSNKPKVVMKWKFMKKQKELATTNMKKLWEPEMEVRGLPKVHFDGPLTVSEPKSEPAESLFSRTTLVTSADSGETGKSHSHIASPSQQFAHIAKTAVPPNAAKDRPNFEPENDIVSFSEQGQCTCNEATLDIQSLGTESTVQEITFQKLNEEMPRSSVSDISIAEDAAGITLSTSESENSHGSEARTEILVNDVSTGLPWLASCFPQKAVELKESNLTPLQSESSLLQKRNEETECWQTNACKMEPNLEVEQRTSSSSASSVTSPVSAYSFDSTPKMFPSPDVRTLQASEDHRETPIITQNAAAEFAGAECVMSLPVASVGSILNNETKTDISAERVLAKPFLNQPTPYEHLDDSVILCDESLIKEARVVRCFCEPTPEEIAEGRGCSTGCINRELYTECGSRCPSGAGCANRRLHNKQYAKVEVFDAGIKGWGLKAAEPLEPGRFIIEYVGEVIDAEEMTRRGRRYGKDPKHVHHYLMALKNGAVIDATMKGNVSRFINHSCDPNCESQKWAVDRQLRVGFFAIKSIAVGEEIVFDYQLERYGRKAQRCFCGAANCRGRIGDDSESEEDEDKIIDEGEMDESEEDEEVPSAGFKVKSQKKGKYLRTAKKRKKQTTAQRYNKAIMNTMSRGPPRNRTQVRELIRLMVQVEQAPQRSSLIQCVRFAHPEVLRLFIQECGLRLLYVFLATDYPIDDEQSVLELQIKSLDLLDVMPVVTKNQVNDSHLAPTVEKIARKRGPVDEVIEDVVKRLTNVICCDMPSTSEYSALTPPEDPDPVIERLHCEMITKAAKLIEKWKNLREEYRIPRRGRTDSVPAQHDISRYVRKAEEDERNKRVIVDKKDDGSTLWRLSGFGPPPKKRFFDRRRFPKTDMPIFIKDLTHLENEDFKQSPIAVTDLTCISDKDDGASKPKKRRSRFDIVGERNPSSMYELYTTDGDPYAPPPPTLLPEAMFAAGLPDSTNFVYQEQPFPEFFDWNAVYAKYDPSSAAYQQFIDYYQQQQYPMMGLPPCPPTPQKVTDMTNILEAPSPPPPKRPKTPDENPNMLIIGPIDTENPTDEDIEMLEKHLAILKSKRAAIKRCEQKQKMAVQELKEVNGIPPPPPPLQAKHSLWVQATTEEGSVYYYNKETRESVWTVPEEYDGGSASADTTTDRIDTRAAFKAEIVKYVGGMLEPIRKLKFASADDYKYVLRKLTHTILEKELKRVGEAELKVTESVRDKARKFVAEYLARLGDGQYSRKNKVHNSY